MIWIVLIGYIINFLLVLGAAASHPAPSTITYSIKEKAMFAVPFGPLIIALVAFILSPWLEL